MLEEIKGYGRCCIANKATGFGYVGAALAIISAFIEYKFQAPTGYVSTFILVWPSIMSLGITSSGMESYRAYKRTKEHIRIHNNLDERFKNLYYTYCGNSGVRAAAKEAGLEHFLQ